MIKKALWALCIGVFGLHAFVLAQSEVRLIHEQRWKNQPIEIKRINVKGKRVELQRGFLGDENWLEGFAFEITNTSSQAIRYVDAALVFPQDDRGLPQRPATEVLRYGTFPRASEPLLDSQQNEAVLAPGQSTVLTVKDYPGMLQLLEWAGHPKNITSVTIRLGRVLFADGTMFSSGEILRRDPKNPESWKVESETKRTANQLISIWQRSPRERASAFESFNFSSEDELSRPDDEECEALMFERPQQCNTYACHTELPYQSTATPILAWNDPPFTGAYSREETVRCNRDDNGQDCFAYGIVVRLYGECTVEPSCESNCVTPGAYGGTDYCLYPNTGCPFGFYAVPGPNYTGCCFFGSGPPTPTPTPTPSPTPTPDNVELCPGGQYVEPGTSCPLGWFEDPEYFACCPKSNPCEEIHGPGWYYWNGGNECVPPTCFACQLNGGTSCLNGNCWTPVLIDVEGDGFNLTNLADGIRFRPEPGVDKIRTAWTAAGSDDAWLVLDRNGNGQIDDATELFSCAAPQPEPPPGNIGNGFIALAEYDKVSNGGNGDGLITKADSVFNDLRLWRDSNHNGRSQNSELFRLRELGLRKLFLDYEESRRTDQHGNKFKYRAKVKDANDAQLGRWAYDVFLLASEE